MKRFLFFPILLLLVASGCDSAGPELEEPPAVLSPQAFALNTSFFDQQPPGSTAAPNAEYSHFLNAAARVGIVSGGVGVHLLIPSAVTQAATQTDPVAEDDGWAWQSQTTWNGQPITLRLTAHPAGGGSGDIAWTMTVDPANENAFTLYTARTSLNGHRGSWDLFYRIEGTSRNVLDAEFEITNDSRELTFSVPADAEAHAGDAVRYAQAGGLNTFVWTQAQTGATTEVTWNPQTKAGALTAPEYNGGARACWGPDLQNAACDG